MKEHDERAKQDLLFKSGSNLECVPILGLLVFSAFYAHFDDNNRNNDLNSA